MVMNNYNKSKQKTVTLIDLCIESYT